MVRAIARIASDVISLELSSSSI